MSHGTCSSVPFTNKVEWLCDYGYEDKKAENEDDIIPCFTNMAYVEELRKLLDYYNANEKLQLGYKTSIDVWFFSQRSG